MTRAASRWHWPKIGRDTILFVSGLTLVVHEAVIRDGPDRPGMLVLFAAMMGLPFMFRATEAVNGKMKERNGDSS